jgi:hypothetical protein
VSSCKDLAKAVKAIAKAASGDFTVLLACDGAFDCTKVGARANFKKGWEAKHTIDLAGPGNVSARGRGGLATGHVRARLAACWQGGHAQGEGGQLLGVPPVPPDKL